MRGNVGKEVLAILDAREIPKAIVVPTVPVMGRTVEKGILRVHGVPLLRTPYAKDPFHPIFTSSLPDLLARKPGSRWVISACPPSEKGPPSLAGKIESHSARILVLDAGDPDTICRSLPRPARFFRKSSPLRIGQPGR